MTINTRMPVNRAGHTAVSTGSEALVCGGFNFKNDKPVLVGNGKDLECWWFTPLPYPRFDPLLLESGSPIPSARWGHTMSDDPKRGPVLLFGGSANAQVFNDCWFLNLSGATSLCMTTLTLQIAVSLQRSTHFVSETSYSLSVPFSESSIRLFAALLPFTVF